MTAPPITEPVQVVVDNGQGFWHDVVTYAPLGTFLVAVLAVTVAWRQFVLARRLRDEQARPYVVASLDATDDWHSVSLAVQNLGQTVAKEVRLEFDPAPMCWQPKRSLDSEPTIEPLRVPQFPVMVPGQRSVTRWGYYQRHKEAGLPTRYSVTVRSKDSNGRDLPPLTYELDWMIPNASPSNNAANRHLASIASSLGKSASRMDREDMKQRMRGWGIAPAGEGRRKVEVTYEPRREAPDEDAPTP